MKSSYSRAASRIATSRDSAGVRGDAATVPFAAAVITRCRPGHRAPGAAGRAGPPPRSRSAPRRRRPSGAAALAQSPSNDEPCMMARRVGFEIGEPPVRRRHGRAERRLVEQVLGRDGGLEDVVAGHGGAVAELGEQVAEEEGPGLLLEEQVGLPVVRHVRRRDLDDAPGEATRRRCRAPPRPPAARGARGSWSCSESITPSAPWATWACGAAARNSSTAPHSSASRWEKAIQRRRSTGITCLDRLAHEREELAHAGVVEQRLLRVDEELVEREAASARCRARRSRSGRSGRRSGQCLRSLRASLWAWSVSWCRCRSGGRTWSRDRAVRR